jgi:ParB-like chromosome segregation protein Spo0J
VPTMVLDIISATDFPHMTAGSGRPNDLADAIDRLPVKHLLLDGLAPGFFVRSSGTDPAHVRMLVEAATSADLPAILVQASNSRIVDGMHRYEASRLRGDETIAVRLIDCSDRDAFILAVKANIRHGLPLARADRTASAQRIVEWHPDWSDRAIGMATALSAKTIAGIRRRCGSESHVSGKRLGRDGKRRPVTAAAGRRRAAEYLAQRPDAPLREVAREADVALATAHDVRARVRRGVDPVARRTRVVQPAVDESEHGESTSSTEVGPEAPASNAAVRNVPSAQPWSTLLPKLANDPSLRYNDCGRAFVSWMVRHVMIEKEWERHLETVPVHWLQQLSQFAVRVGQEWLEFGEELHRREDQLGFSGCRTQAAEL